MYTNLAKVLVTINYTCTKSVRIKFGELWELSAFNEVLIN